MIYQQPADIIGQSISAWDRFYDTHFEWVYNKTLGFCHNTLKAKTLTDKIFAKVFLNNPSCIVENSEVEFKKELGILFPYLGIRVDQNKALSAGRLLHLYYLPN